MKKTPTEEENMFYEKLEQQQREDKQKLQAARAHYDKYLDKLDEKERAGDFSGKDLPFYLQKDWLEIRAGELLGLVMFKRPGSPQLVIYPHEAAMLLKRTIRSAQKTLKMIREKNNKAPRMPVTLQEFCDHFGFDIEEVKKELTS